MGNLQVVVKKDAKLSGLPSELGRGGQRQLMRGAGCRKRMPGATGESYQAQDKVENACWLFHIIYSRACRRPKEHPP